MNVFVDRIPVGSPVVVALVTMEGCGACQEFMPTFTGIAESFAKRGLPIVHLDAATQDPATLAFLNKHGVEATPTVIAATLNRGPVARLEGAVSGDETRRFFETAWAHNRPRSLW